jgi:hypothetical protein
MSPIILTVIHIFFHTQNSSPLRLSRHRAVAGFSNAT